MKMILIVFAVRLSGPQMKHFCGGVSVCRCVGVSVCVTNL